MAQIAAANIVRWPVGVEFPVGPKMSEITLEVILRTVVGATEPARLAALRAVMPRVLNLDPWSTLAIYNPKLQQRRPWRNVRRRLEEADALLYAEIADRRAAPDLAARTDVLAMLVRAADDDGRQMSDRELRDQLMTLLAAGHDTTATALSWTLERLTRHPVLLAEAVAAAAASAVGDPAADEYLDAVCKETLRIRPVVFDVGRKPPPRSNSVATESRPVSWSPRVSGWSMPARPGTRNRIGSTHIGCWVPIHGPQPWAPPPGCRSAGQPPVSGRQLRADRDAGHPARGVAPGRVEHHHSPRRGPTGARRDP